MASRSFALISEARTSWRQTETRRLSIQEHVFQSSFQSLANKIFTKTPPRASTRWAAEGDFSLALCRSLLRLLRRGCRSSGPSSLASVLFHTKTIQNEGAQIQIRHFLCSAAAVDLYRTCTYMSKQTSSSSLGGGVSCLKPTSKLNVSQRPPDKGQVCASRRTASQGTSMVPNSGLSERMLGGRRSWGPGAGVLAGSYPMHVHRTEGGHVLSQRFSRVVISNGSQA